MHFQNYSQGPVLEGPNLRFGCHFPFSGFSKKVRVGPRVSFKCNSKSKTHHTRTLLGPFLPPTGTRTYPRRLKTRCPLIWDWCSTDIWFDLVASLTPLWTHPGHNTKPATHDTQTQNTLCTFSVVWRMFRSIHRFNSFPECLSVHVLTKYKSPVVVFFTVASLAYPVLLLIKSIRSSF